MSPHADVLSQPKLARDMSWHAWMAARSEGLATFYVCADELTGELFYGLVRSRRDVEED